MTSKHADMPLVGLSCVGMVAFRVGKRGAVSTLTHAAKVYSFSKEIDVFS
jgi:hypothetical protein